MKNILLKCKNNIYIAYTILFTIIGGLAFYSFIKLGKTFIWNQDGFTQHYIILYDFNKMIKNGFSFFSWNMGLGLDVIGQYSYYILGDPFAYISLLFPLKYLKYTYSALVILRMYLVGISFIVYCKYNKKEELGTLIGAIIYTFCGYIFYAAVRHPYFTNAAIILPFVLLGIDKILKENKYIFFTVTIAILSIMNYYFLYMITILAVIYAIVKFIVEYREEGLKTFGIKFIKTVFSYIIGVMIGSIILLPTIYAFLNSDRAGVDYTYYSLGYYEKLFFGQPDTPFWSKTYVFAILLLILPVAILNQKKDKENKTYLINATISIFILLTPFLGSVMNGFSFQSNRWVFGYAFFMSYLVAINLKEDLRYSIKQIILMLGTIIIYCILALVSTLASKIFILMSLFTAILMILVIVINNISKRDLVKRICKIAIIVLVQLNIIIYAWSLYDIGRGEYVKQFANYSNVDKRYNSYDKKIKKFNKSIKYINSNDKTQYRIGIPIYNSNNMPIKHGYKGLNTYLSIGNGYVSNLTKDLLILNITKTDNLKELDSRTKITTLLGCKYYVTSEKDRDYIPYGYELINSENKGNEIYKNKNALSLGAFYDNYILKNDYNKLSPLEKEQAFLDTAVLDENIKGINYDRNLIDEIKDKTTNEIDYEIRGTSKKFTINFDEVKNSELYLYFENLKYDNTDEYHVSVKYNNIKKRQVVRNKITTAYYVETPNILFNLGYKETHKGKIEVDLQGIGSFKYDKLKLISVPMNEYEKSINKLKQTHFEIEECENSEIIGRINNNANGILQIPTSYSKGWKAYVDGKETKVINVNTGFIGIELKEGEHVIKFKYTTPYLKFGVIISFFGTLILILLVLRNRKLKCFNY